jgi:hypothetical protein
LMIFSRVASCGILSCGALCAKFPGTRRVYNKLQNLCPVT